MAHPTRPLITIVAAPGSLCLTGYLKNFAEPNFYLVVALFALSQVLYFVVLSMLPRLFKLRFYQAMQPLHSRLLSLQQLYLLLFITSTV